MPYIEVDNITKRFDDKLVLDDVSFNIEKGDIFGLLGPNGAGKSTLVSIMTGLLAQDKGDIKIDGHSVKKEALKVKSLIGFVPQEIALYEKLSARENLEFWGALSGLKGRMLKSRVKEAIELAGLSDSFNMPVKKYSGGMKRRLNIACAVMSHPEVLIMDEPTVGVDPQSRNHIFEFTKNINRTNGTTVIYISHYMEEIDALCKNLFIMDLGKEVAKGSLDDVKKMASDISRIEVETQNFNERAVLDLKKQKGIQDIVKEDSKIIIKVINNEFDFEGIVKILIENNVKFSSINIKEPTLEEVFLTITGKKLRD